LTPDFGFYIAGAEMAKKTLKEIVILPSLRPEVRGEVSQTNEFELLADNFYNRYLLFKY